MLDEGRTTLRVARGDSFTLSVKVRPGDRVPETARATYHFADGEQASEPLRSAEGGEFKGRIDSVTQPFAFSVAAGDDSTSIRDVAVQVVPPPALNSLAIKLVSPEYTGMPAQVLAPGLTQLRALEGTRLELDGLANKPLARAELRRGDQQVGAALAFDAGRTRFKTTLDVKGNFSFWFELKDTEGFQNREAVKYDVRGFRDEAPRVVLDEPKSDRDVPADATIPIHVSLDDDFGLHSSRIIYRLATGDSEPNGEVVIPVWSAAQRQPGEAFVKHQEIAYRWELTPLKLPVGTVITFFADARDFDTLKGPNVGKSREIRLRIVSKEDAARQFDDGRRELREEIARVLTMEKQAIVPVESAIRTLSQTDQLPGKERDDLKNAGMIQRQVNSRLNNRDEGVGARLTRMLDDQRNFKIDNADAQKQMEDMLAQLEVIRERNLGPAEQGLTRATKNLDQNAATPSPSQPKTGSEQPDSQPAAPDRAQPKADDAPAPGASPAPKSKSGSPQGKNSTAKQSAAQAKGASERPDATAANDKKGEAREGGTDQANTAKADSKPQPSRSAPAKSPKQATQLALNESKTNQKAIADELQKMLDSLSEFETYRGVVKDAQELLKQQEQTMKQTDEAASRPETMGQSVDELSPEQKADLGNLASRQSQVGKGLQNLLERMGEMAGRLNESDPMAAAAMREAAAKTQQKGTTGKIGEAADQLEKNQMGEARIASGAGSRRLERAGRLDPEPPRARAFQAGQRAQERRGRTGEDPRQPGPEPEKNA